MEIVQVPDGYVLTIDGSQWMGYCPKTKEPLNQNITEVDLGYGHCVVTGLGLGLRELLLIQKPTVYKVTVIELFPEIIEWFVDASKKCGIDISKIEFINDDANNIKSLECNCLFPNHIIQGTDEEIIDGIKSFALHHKYDVLWFYPMLEIYGKWAKKHQNPVSSNTFQQWATSCGLKIHNFSDQFLFDQLRAYFRLASKAKPT